MSGSSSEGECSSGSESEIPKGLAHHLRDLPLQRMVHDPTWNAHDSANFQDRLSGPLYSHPIPGGGSVPHYARRPPSSTSSMAYSYASSTNSSNYIISRANTARTPSLTRSPYSPTASSISAGIASVPRYALPSVNGSSNPTENPAARDIRIAQPTATRSPWPCPFIFLGCDRTCIDVSDWTSHCAWHLNDDFPKQLPCLFQCDHEFALGSGAENWRQHCAHVRQHHPHGGRVATWAPTRLVEHLFRRRIINAGEEQRLRLHGSIQLGATPMLRQAGRLADDRRERRDRRGAGRP